MNDLQVILIILAWTTAAVVALFILVNVMRILMHAAGVLKAKRTDLWYRNQISRKEFYNND